MGCPEVIRGSTENKYLINLGLKKNSLVKKIIVSRMLQRIINFEFFDHEAELRNSFKNINIVNEVLVTSSLVLVLIKMIITLATNLRLSSGINLLF